jgi:hypothetical protein
MVTGNPLKYAYVIGSAELPPKSLVSNSIV